MSERTWLILFRFAAFFTAVSIADMVMRIVWWKYDLPAVDWCFIRLVIQK